MDDIVRDLAAQDKQKKDNHGKQNFISLIISDFKQGFIVIAFAFAIVIGVYFTYQAVKEPPLIVGQGLAFDRITIERDGDIITANGSIVNAMSDKRGVPNIMVTQIMAGDVKGDSFILEPDKHILDGGEMLTFSIKVENIDPSVQNFTFGFDMANDTN
jgi:hypothetical protein